MDGPRQHDRAELLPRRPEAGEPYRLAVTKSGLEGTFALKDEAAADDLIRAINAFKVLLRQADAIRPPGDGSRKDED